MKQNRPAPAYQEYAAAMMAKLEYRMLSLAERGLLYSMRLECWVNSKVPANAGDLAKILGFSTNEVADALPAVMPFFQEHSRHLYSPELEDYRSHLSSVRAKQSAGGKIGATLTNRGRTTATRKSDTGDSSGESPGDSRDKL